MLLGVFFLFLVSIVGALPTPRITDCAPTCLFRLCDPSPLSLLTESDVPITSSVCSETGEVGTLNTGEALALSFNSSYIPLSNLTLPGLAQPYSPSFFKAYSNSSGSAIGHETPQQNQADFLLGACLALPIRQYEIIDENGSVTESINLQGSPLVNCVPLTIANFSSPVVTPTASLTPAVSPVAVSLPPATPTALPTPDESPVSTSEVSLTPPIPTASPTHTGSPVVVPDVSSPPPPPTTLPSPTSSPFGPPSVIDGTINGTVTFPPDTRLSETFSVTVEVDVTSESGSSKEDFYLLSDATSSMRTAIETVREKFMEVVAARAAVSSNVQFGVGFYKDERESDAFTNVQEITRNITQIDNAIQSLRAGSDGNPDAEEGNLNALYQIATLDSIGWRPDSRRILVYFGDAPGHEPTCVGNLELTRDNVISALEQKGITVVANSFVGGSSPGLDAATSSFGCFEDEQETEGGQGTDITTQTGGQIVEEEDQDRIVDIILSSVGNLSQILEADTSDCDEKDIEVAFEPSLPLSIDSGTTVTLTETVQIREGVCDAEGPGFSCTVRFTSSGAQRGEQTLAASKVIGC